MEPVHKRLLLLEDNEDMGKPKDWRKALRAQPAYRIVNRTIRGQTQFISVVAFVGLLVLFILYLWPRSRRGNTDSVLRSSNYNYTYPLTSPIKTNSMYTFRIGIIADLDTNSKSDLEKNIWYSYFMKGYLSYSPIRHTVVVTWDRRDPIQLKNSYSLKGRGVELSELIVFDGRLLTFDDRTGLVFDIIDDKLIPWILLTDGNGKSTKGFKSEWATVKDELLYVGSMGKEWTTPNGVFENHNPQYIKKISTDGRVVHVNWVNEYKRIRAVLEINWPGYMIHESAVWSDVHRRWFFLPRRCSKEQYNETLDEHRGCSVLISADEGLYDVKIVHLPNKSSTRGFSSFKFIPMTNDEVIVALKTEEVDGKQKTYITSFNIKGEILLDDFYVSDLKYEGLEFI